MRREDGSSLIISNIYKHKIDTEPKQKQQRAPRRSERNQDKVIEHEQRLVDDAAKGQEDVLVLQVVQAYLDECLDVCYTPLIEELYQQITPEHAILEENDRFYFIKMQTFAMEVVRLQAGREHREAQRKA
jgi:hypothetical protein